MYVFFLLDTFKQTAVNMGTVGKMFSNLSYVLTWKISGKSNGRAAKLEMRFSVYFDEGFVEFFVCGLHQLEIEGAAAAEGSL